MKNDFQYILFDLDGTLTDSGEGITKAVQYALKNFDIEVEDLNELRKFVGPPLRDSYKN
ncbi:MAG: HAD hydrolase-like protein, partial [Clostridium butyricum]|nr:HAD hydrolase-like protein [Clostridium butyricum]